jgi:hypothetical protein
MKTVQNWLEVLRRLEIPEQGVLAAIAFNAEKPMSQERRQAYFSKWLAARAAGDPDDSTEEHGEAPISEQTTEQSTPEPTADTSTDEETPEDEARDREQALDRIHVAMGDHDYPEEPVVHLAALIACRRPGAQIDWEQIPPSKLNLIADLLNSAGELEWGADQLDKEIVKASEANQQSTPAGRFAAFASYLTDLAETRLRESTTPAGAL